MADNVFINGRAAVHAGSMGKSVAFPDVCLCPPSPPSGPIPTPLVNTAVAADLDGCAATVTVEGNRIAHLQSFVAKSTGDEVAQSTGGGIISHTTQGKAYFQTFSMNVMIENQPAVRHLDLVTNNHLAKMPGNTPPVPWMSTMLAGPGPAPREVEKRVGKKKDWIRLRVVDQNGYPVFGSSYEITLPDNKVIKGRLPSGGVVAFRGFDKGLCEVKFDVVPAIAGQSRSTDSQARVYKGSPLRLDSGKEHRIQVTIPRVLCVHLPIDPTDQAYANDQFIVRSTDSSYEAKRSIADQAIGRGRKLTLEFPDLVPGKLYSLVHERDGELLGAFFTEQSYDELFPDPTTNTPRHLKETRVEIPAAFAGRLLFGAYIDEEDDLLSGELEVEPEAKPEQG
jgi:hypothetical protein